MVVGVMTLVGLQTFLNIGVVTGLLPTTGISLPFFSYGGTSADDFVDGIGNRLVRITLFQGAENVKQHREKFLRSDC